MAFHLVAPIANSTSSSYLSSNQSYLDLLALSECIRTGNEFNEPGHYLVSLQKGLGGNSWHSSNCLIKLHLLNPKRFRDPH